MKKIVICLVVATFTFHLGFIVAVFTGHAGDLQFYPINDLKESAAALVGSTVPFSLACLVGGTAKAGAKLDGAFNLLMLSSGLLLLLTAVYMFWGAVHYFV